MNKKTAKKLARRTADLAKLGAQMQACGVELRRMTAEELEGVFHLGDFGALGRLHSLMLGHILAQAADILLLEGIVADQKGKKTKGKKNA